MIGRATQADRCVNLTFHGVGEPPRRLTPEEQEVWVSLEQFHTALDEVQARPEIRLSFDDGNISDLHHALPALRQRCLKATYFVVAERLGEPGFLAPDDICSLSQAGMTIGCHGLQHRAWRRLDDRELRDELLVSKRIIENIVNHPVTHAACPFGSYDRRALRALRNYGYERVFTSDRGIARSDAWLQARNSIDHRAGHRAIAQIVAPDKDGGRALVRKAKLAVKRYR